MGAKYWTRSNVLTIWTGAHGQVPRTNQLIGFDTEAFSPNDTALRTLVDIRMNISNFSGRANGWDEGWWLGQEFIFLTSVLGGIGDVIVDAANVTDPRVTGTGVLTFNGYEKSTTIEEESALYQTSATFQTKGQRKSPIAGQLPVPAVTLWSFPMVTMGTTGGGYQILLQTYMRTLFESH